MSNRDPKTYLYDIISSCEFLLEFTRNRTIQDYQQDRGFRSAVERELQIIGEAMMQLEDIRPDLTDQIPDVHRIIGFRHVLVHGYASLDPKTVWNVVETKLESLRDEIRRLFPKC